MPPIIVIALTLLAFLSPIPADAGEPFELEILLDGVPQQGAGWVLTVTLFAKTDLDQTDLTVEHSKGLQIEAGEPHWQGTLPNGAEQVVELSMELIAPPPQEIVIRIQGRDKHGTPFREKIIRRIENRPPSGR